MADVYPAHRRRLLATAALGAAAGCALAIARPAPALAQQKTAKADASYQDHPNGAAHCEACTYFQPPLACRLVRGEISPNGWCGFFQARTG